MCYLVLNVTNSTISTIARKERLVGSFLQPSKAVWKEQQSAAGRYPATNTMAEWLALFWLNFFSFLTKQPFGATLDPEEWLEAFAQHFRAQGNATDLAQAYNLAGCWQIRKDPIKAIAHFDEAERLLKQPPESEVVLEIQINKMVAYVSFKPSHDGYENAKLEACRKLAYLARTDPILSPEGALACFYTLARLSELISPNARVAGGESLWPVPSDEAVKLPNWTSVAEFVIRNYINTNRQEAGLSTDAKANAFLNVAYRNNIGLLREASGNYNIAILEYKEAIKLTKTLQIPTAPDATVNQSKDAAEANAAAIRRELQIFIMINMSLSRSLFTKASIVALNQNAARSAMSTGNLGSVHILDWAHYYAACGSDETAKIYNYIVRARKDQAPTATMFLKRLIAAYQILNQDRTTYLTTWQKLSQELFKGAYLFQSSTQTNLPEIGSHLRLEVEDDALALPSLMLGALLPIYEYYRAEIAKLTLSLESLKELRRDKPHVVIGTDPDVQSKWRALEENDFNGIRQFSLELQSPFFGSDDWLVYVMLSLGLTSCDFKNYKAAIRFFVRVFTLLEPKLPSILLDASDPLKDQETTNVVEVAGEYIRYANRQSQFFLASVPPHEIDAFHCKPDNDTNSTTYLCPPMEWSDLTNVAVTWYWRTVKIDALVNMQLRRPANIKLGYRNVPPTPLGLIAPVVGPDDYTLEPRLGPINMSISIVTKVATAVPRSCALLLHDSERIELKVQLRDPLKVTELDQFKQQLADRKDTTHPKKRYRFHVLECRSDGSIKMLTRGANMSGYAINIPFHTVSNSTTVRLGAITTQHEPLSLYFEGSIYELHTPLDHAFVLMVREDNDNTPPLFDCRFFEQTSAIDIDACTRRSVIRRSYDELQGQYEGRLLAKPTAAGIADKSGQYILDGDTFHVEWFRIRSLPNPSPPTKLFQPSAELRLQVYKNSNRQAVVPGNTPKTAPVVTGQTRISPLVTLNDYARNLSHVRINTTYGVPNATRGPESASDAYSPALVLGARVRDSQHHYANVLELDKAHMLNSALSSTFSPPLIDVPMSDSRRVGFNAASERSQSSLQSMNYVAIPNLPISSHRDCLVKEVLCVAQVLFPQLSAVAFELVPTTDVIAPPSPPHMEVLDIPTSPVRATTPTVSLSTVAPYEREMQKVAKLTNTCIISYTIKSVPRVIVALPKLPAPVVVNLPLDESQIIHKLSNWKNSSVVRFSL